MTAITRLQVGTRFYYDGDEWVTVGLHGATIRARSHSNTIAVLSLQEIIEHASLLSSAEEVEADVTAPHFVALPPSGTFADDPKAQQRREVVQALLTGYPEGVAREDEPESIYGPGTGRGLEERVNAYASDHGKAPSTIWRWIALAREQGADGLTDRRRMGIANPFGRCPQEVVDVMRHIAVQQPDLSRTTDRFALQQVRRIVKERHGEAVRVPADSSLYRYWKGIKDEFALHVAKQTQRSNAVRPKHIGEPLAVSRPFEVVEIDSTRLDLLALSPLDGKPVPLSLTIAVDLYTRSIVAARFAPVAEKGTDAALLLFDMVSPKLWHPTWGEEAKWRYGIPEQLLLPDGVTTITPLTGVPVGCPATLSLDNGQVYVSDAMKSAAIRLGINLQYSRKGRPTDKAHVERTFGTIRSRFVQHLPGYTGSRVDDRGSKAKVDDAACLLIPEIEALFAQWVATEYQNTPHKGLFNPAIPSQKMTPNEAYDIGIATTGYIPILADRDLAISLLPGKSRQIGVTGIEFQSLFYDSRLLDPYRKRKSPFTELGNKWPVRFDSRDLSHIWVWLGDAHDRLNGQWVRIPARITRTVGAFSDIHLAYAKSLFSDEDRRTKRADLVERVEQTMIEMFERVAAFGPANRREATVFRHGGERAAAATATFPHDSAELDIEPRRDDADENNLDSLDFHDIEPYDIGWEA